MTRQASDKRRADHQHGSQHQVATEVDALLTDAVVEQAVLEVEQAVLDVEEALEQVQQPVRGQQPDTRSRIQQIALELFTENGYEATSLREIAERLGFTKAALYYHFKTKDDIIASLVDSRVARIDEVIAWARTQPRTTEARRDFIMRYATLLEDGHHQKLMRFFERNQTAMHHHKASMAMRERILTIMELLRDPDEPLADRMRRSLAVFALHSVWFFLNDPDITDAQRRAAAVEVALDLVSRPAMEPTRE